MRDRDAGKALVLAKKFAALSNAAKTGFIWRSASSSYRNTKSTRQVYRLRWRGGRSGPRPGIGGEIEELTHIRHGLVPLGESGQVETRFNQLERRRVIHRSMGYEIFLGKWRDHHQRYAKTGQGKVTRLVCCWHDRRDTVRAGDGDWRNVIVQAPTLIERLNQNGIFPRLAVHKSIDEFRRKLRAQLDVALRMLVNTAAAGVIHFDTSFNVRDLGQRAVLHISKILAQRNHVRMVGIEIGEIRKIRVPIRRIDFPRDVVGIHHFKNRFRGYLLGRRYDKPLRRGRHPVKAVWMRARGGR